MDCDIHCLWALSWCQYHRYPGILCLKKKKRRNIINNPLSLTFWQMLGRLIIAVVLLPQCIGENCGCSERSSPKKNVLRSAIVRGVRKTNTVLKRGSWKAWKACLTNFTILRKVSPEQWCQGMSINRTQLNLKERTHHVQWDAFI